MLFNMSSPGAHSVTHVSNTCFAQCIYTRAGRVAGWVTQRSYPWSTFYTWVQHVGYTTFLSLGHLSIQLGEGGSQLARPLCKDSSLVGICCLIGPQPSTETRVFDAFCVDTACVGAPAHSSLLERHLKMAASHATAVACWICE